MKGHNPLVYAISTMHENDGNLANYQELGEHIKRLGGKLNGMAKGSDEYEETKEHLEMYYERLHQIEQMRTSTIEAERDEEKTARLEAEEKHAKSFRRLVLVSLCLALCMAAILEEHVPGAITQPVEWFCDNVLSSTPSIVAITATVVHGLTRWWHPH